MHARDLHTSSPVTVFSSPLRGSKIAQSVVLASLDNIELRGMANTAAEPLIAGRPAVPRDDSADGYEDERALVRPGRFIWVLTFCAGVSGLLFGYEYVLPSTPHRLYINSERL